MYFFYCIMFIAFSNNVNNDIGILNSVNHDAKFYLESPMLLKTPQSSQFWWFQIIEANLFSEIMQ